MNFLNNELYILEETYRCFYSILHSENFLTILPDYVITAYSGQEQHT